MTKEESYKIQLLRGIAIIGVVCIHNAPPETAQIWFRPFINFSVALFLFISGFLSSKERWNPRKRIRKVIIPYLLWTVVYTVLNSHTGFRSFLYSLIFNTLTGSSAAVMYYIFVYIQLTLLILPIDQLARSRFRIIGLLISPLEILLFRLIPLLSGSHFGLIFETLTRLSCLGWFTYFYLGYLIGNKLVAVTMSNSKIVLFVLMGLCWQVIEGYFYQSLGSLDYGTQLKFSSFFTNIFLMLLAYKFIISGKEFKNRFLYVTGNNSFGIFFIHLAIMRVLPLYSRIVFPLNAILITIVSLLVILLLKKILGKQAWFFGF